MPQESSITQPDIMGIGAKQSSKSKASGKSHTSTIVRSPTETIDDVEMTAANATTEHNEPLYGHSSNYNPRPIRSRKRREFPGSGMHIAFRTLITLLFSGNE